MFSFLTDCHSKVNEPSLSYYLPIAWGRRVGVMPFPKLFALCEIQTILFRIWTLAVKFTFYDSNCYITSAFYTHKHKKVYPKYDAKMDLVVRLQFWSCGEYGVTFSLLPGPFWPGVVVIVSPINRSSRFVWGNKVFTCLKGLWRSPVG